MKKAFPLKWVFPLLLSGISIQITSFANAAEESALEKLESMSLQQLMDIEITIATKKEKKSSTVAAPVFVISAEDIRRSGVSNVPEALAMAPGVQVAQLGPHDWAISIRGFNALLSNKLLVLVDGRIVYSPVNAGTYWRDIQSISLEDIKQIEIIRGPGGTIWGANAVNGVINIITYSAMETEGAQLVVGGGSEQRAFTRLSYTHRLSQELAIRAYANYFKVDDAKGLSGQDNQDGGDGWRSGFRADFQDQQNNVHIDGNWYEHYLNYNSEHTILEPPYRQISNERPGFRGGHIMARWNRLISADNQWSLQAYFDFTKRNDPILQVAVEIFDIEFNHQFTWLDRHTISWGGGYRQISDDVSSTLTLTMQPAKKATDLFNFFVQDEISLDQNKRWLLTAGSKFEYYSLGNLEVQPSLSLIWNLSDKISLWGSISHAVRTLTRDQNDLKIFAFRRLLMMDTPVKVQGVGGEDLDAEQVTAFQVGWRAQLPGQVMSKVAFFYNRYEDIIKTEMLGFPLLNEDGLLSVQSQLDNLAEAQSYGVEVALDWAFADWWRNYFSYSYFRLNSRHVSDRHLFFPDLNEVNTPEHSASLRMQFNLTDTIELDAWFRYTDEIKVVEALIDDYVDLDMRLGWQVNSEIEVSLIGQNLIQTQHKEYDDEFFYPQASRIERGVYGKLVWRF